MQTIETVGRIKEYELSGARYMQTLLELAEARGLLSASELERIQLDCLGLLTELTRKYTGGQSSSVRIETAQQLLDSILYTVSMRLKLCHTPDEAAELLKAETLETLYEAGRKQIDKLAATTRILHGSLVKKLIDTPNVFYRSTAEDGINGFFKLYSPEFGAQEIHITADYPTCNGVSDLAGIEFIRRYLDNIFWENQFCALFRAEDIHRLLYAYEKDYRSLLINLYEPVLTTAVGCALAEKEILPLRLSAFDLSYLESLFKGAGDKELGGLLREGVEKLSQKLELSEELVRYLDESLVTVAGSVRVAAESNSLDRVFLIQKDPKSEPVVLFSSGDKMGDECYRAIVEELLQCGTTARKLQIIKNGIHTLADLHDILADAELSETETDAVLKELAPEEIAALIKKYPIDDDFLEAGYGKEGEMRLLGCLRRYVDSLPKERRAWLLGLSEQLRDQAELEPID